MRINTRYKSAFLCLFFKELFTQADGADGETSQRMRFLAQRIRTYRTQIAALGYEYNESAAAEGDLVKPDESGALDNTDFAARLNDIKEQVNNSGETAQKALVALFEAESRINYRQNGVSTIDNGTNVALVAAAAFVVAFLLASIVFCAADYPAYKRAREEKRAAAEPSEESAEPPAADNPSGTDGSLNKE